NPFGYGGVGRTAAHQAKGRIEQEQAEDPGDPFETIQETDASETEQRAENDRSADAPDQGAVLALPADPEALKDDQEDEEIVDAERGFNGVASEPLERGLAALCHADPGTEADRGQHHAGGADPGEQLRI